MGEVEHQLSVWMTYNAGRAAASRKRTSCGARMRFQTRCNFHLGHIAALPHASRTCLAVQAIRWQITIPAHSAACSSMLGGCGAKPSPPFKPLHLLPLNVCCAVVQPLLLQKALRAAAYSRSLRDMQCRIERNRKG